MGGGKAQKAPNLAGPQELSELFWEAEYQVENLPAATPPGAIQPFPQQEKHRQPDWMPDVKQNGKRHHGRRALPKTTSRLLENQTNHAGDFEQLKYKDSQFPGIIEARIGKEISATATHAWVPTVDAGGIAIIDTSTFAFVSALVSETNPYGIAATPDGSKIYVTESGTNLVSSFEVASLVGATTEAGGHHDRRRGLPAWRHGLARRRPRVRRQHRPERRAGRLGHGLGDQGLDRHGRRHVHGRSGAADHRGLARQLQAVRDLRAGAVHGRRLQRPQEAGRDASAPRRTGSRPRPTATGCSSPTRSTTRCWCSTARASRSPVRSRSARPRGTSRSRRTRSRPT